MYESSKLHDCKEFVERFEYRGFSWHLIKKIQFFPCTVLFQRAKNNFLNYNHFFNKFTNKNEPRLLNMQFPVYYRRKTYKSPKNNNYTADNSILNLNAPQNKTRPAPTNYNDIYANGSYNSDDDLMDATDCIGYVKTMDYTDPTDATENDENINYDEYGIFYSN
jgi:hypothetical protein